MPIKQNELHQILADNFPNAKIEITDLAGDDDHYSLKISDESFRGKTKIAQHKMVKEALKDLLLSNKLHAIQIKTSTL